MTAPLDSESSQSSSGYEDGLGRRALAFDRETGGMLERLVLRPELTAFEDALKERIAIVTGLEDERFARPRVVERGDDGRLTVVSEYLAGRRLSDIIDAAAEHGIVAGLDASIGLLLELLPAVARLHDAGLSHGALAPGRVMITPAGQIVLLDSIYAEPLERLKLTRKRLWAEFRLAFPPTAGLPRFDKAADLGHASMVAATLIVGRALQDSDYPEGVTILRQEILEIASIRGSKGFAEAVDKIFASTLPLAGRRTTPSADEAAIDLRKLVRKELGINTCRTALIEFFQQVESAEAERLAAVSSGQGAVADSERPAEVQVDTARLEAQRAAAERADAERAERARVETENARLEAERIEQEHAERARAEQVRAEKARVEAERIERELAENARLEAERIAREEGEKARVEAERIERERAEKARLEAERIARERVEQEQREAERAENARLERERAEKARLEAERIAREKAERAEAERAEKARLEAERLERERLEAERLAREKAEKARLEAERAEKARLEAERLERERLEAERIAREKAEQARLEAERAEKARLEAERLERERLEAERAEQARLEAERIAREKAERARLEAERLEKERAEKARLEAERAEAARVAREKAEKARLEAERIEKERAEKARLDAERVERERQEKARLEAERREKARLEAERVEQERAERARIENERLERERAEAARLAEEARLKAERLERERLEAQREAERARLESERLAQERADAERRERERVETDRRERERLETEGLEADRAAADRGDREREEAARIERERAAAAAIAAVRAADPDGVGVDADATPASPFAAAPPLAVPAPIAPPPPPAPPVTDWLVSPDRAASFEPALQDAPPPAPTARVYPIYVPPAEPAAWTPDLPPTPEPNEVAPVAARAPAIASSATPASSGTGIRLQLKEDTFADGAARSESRREPETMSAAEAYEPFRSKKPRQPIPWKLIAAGLVLIAGAAAFRFGYTPSADPIVATARKALPAATTTPRPTATPVGGTVGRVTITTQPGGAKIQMDGKPVGESPLTLESVAPGRHVITIAGAGGTTRRNIRVEAGKTLALDVPLFSGFAAIAAPFVVDVSENGKALGTNENPVLLSPGRHELRLANKELGYVATETVEIQAGEVTRLTLDPRGTANINAAPWAEVWIDGEKAGETPLANVPIRLGIREIVFKNPQYPDRKLTVTIQATNPATIAVDFLK